MGPTAARIVQEGFQAQHKQSRHTINTVSDLTRLDLKIKQQLEPGRRMAQPDSAKHWGRLWSGLKHTYIPTHAAKRTEHETRVGSRLN